MALNIGKDKDGNELSDLGSFWPLVGQILEAESAQKELLESKKEKLKEIKELKKKIKRGTVHEFSA